MTTTYLSRSLLAVAAITLAACGRNPDLSPAPGTLRVQGPGESAVATAEGVRLIAQVQVWEGEPKNLPDVMTPVRVEIFNGSEHPIQIRSQDFELVTASHGERLAAIPPYNIDETVPQRVEVPYYYPYDPFYHGYYGDDFYYDVVNVELPTQQMIDFALPEGVIEPGGSAAGFLYFEDIDQDETAVRLVMPLMDARTTQPFGRIEIPFTVH